MCSLCGSLGQGPAWENDGRADGADARWRLRREAQETATVMTRLLAPQRIRIDAHPDFGFVIALPTGGVLTATSVAEIWHSLDRAGRPVPDPLDA